MFFNLLIYMFGVTTKHILNTNTANNKRYINLSLTKLDTIKIFGVTICRVTHSNNVTSYHILGEDALNELKVELYYDFVGRLNLLQLEISIDGKCYFISKLLNSLPTNDIVITDSFILNKDKTILYGISSTDYHSRKLYKKLTKIVKEVK